MACNGGMADNQNFSGRKLLKYLSKKPFTGGVNSDAYRANFEDTFGKKEPNDLEREIVKPEEVERSTMPTEEEWRDLWYRIDCRLELDRRNPERTDGTDAIRSWIVGAITRAVGTGRQEAFEEVFEEGFKMVARGSGTIADLMVWLQEQIKDSKRVT